MKLENQVILPSQGKRLRELGISMESYFVLDEKGTVSEYWGIEGTEADFFPAFTVAELGAMLPIMF